MPCYVYVLRSLQNGDIYIGSTADISQRISLHNSGKVKSTKAYRPWVLLEYQAMNTRSEAVRQERFLKNHQQKEQIKRKFNLNNGQVPE